MILVFDVGNTETTIGLFDGETMRGHWRIISGVERTADEFSVLLRGLLALDGFESDGIDGAAVGSVVPRVTESLVAACKTLSSGAVIVVDARRCPSASTSTSRSPSGRTGSSIRSPRPVYLRGMRSWSTWAPPRPSIASRVTARSSAA
jgi:hypothetical protein